MHKSDQKCLAKQEPSTHDIRENVQYVVDNGKVRLEDDGTLESTNIVRFLENVVGDYPSTIDGPLTAKFVETTRELYQQAVRVLRTKLEELDQQLEENRRQLEENRRQIEEMDELIATMQTLLPTQR